MSQTSGENITTILEKINTNLEKLVSQKKAKSM